LMPGRVGAVVAGVSGGERGQSAPTAPRTSLRVTKPMPGGVIRLDEHDRSWLAGELESVTSRVLGVRIAVAGGAKHLDWVCPAFWLSSMGAVASGVAVC
jgi:hypothetical protein